MTSARGRRSALPTDPPGAAEAHINDVRLVGTLASVELRTLPSGDQLHTFRLTVRRPPPARSAGAARRAASVDAIDCVAGTAPARRSLAACAPGDTVEVAGRLQRRFWRSVSGPASAYQVEAATIRRPGPRRRSRSAGSEGPA